MYISLLHSQLVNCYYLYNATSSRVYPRVSGVYPRAVLFCWQFTIGTQTIVPSESACAALGRCSGKKCPLFWGLFVFLLFWVTYFEGFFKKRKMLGWVSFLYDLWWLHFFSPLQSTIVHQNFDQQICNIKTNYKFYIQLFMVSPFSQRKDEASAGITKEK